MEVMWSVEFSFENTVNIWCYIYVQKFKCLNDNKLAEFNFKVLNNILPCGYILSKWNHNVENHVKLQ